MGIQLRNIHKSRQYDILKGVDLEIEDEAFLSLVAPTGNGKTTLLRVLAGIEKPDEGQILVDGEDVTGVHVRKRNIAMVYQQFINYPTLTVYENIASPLRVSDKNYSKKDIDKRVNEIAEQLRITPLLDRMPSEISGGQQQRVAIARALVKDARLVMLDEPLGNLDYKLREDLRIEIKELARARKNSIFIYATPEPIDALTMASHVAIMHEGQVIQSGTMRDVYRKPAHRYAGEYFSSPPMNFIPCTIRDTDIVIDESVKIPLRAMKMDVPPGDYILGVRPHHMYLSADHKDSLGEDVVLPVRVELAEIVGSDTTLHVYRDGMTLTALTQDYRQFELNQQIEIYLDPRRMHLFDARDGQLVRTALAER